MAEHNLIASLPQDLRGRSFQNMDLRDWDFSSRDISGCNFSKAKLTNANFSNVVAKPLKIYQPMNPASRLAYWLLIALKKLPLILLIGGSIGGVGFSAIMIFGGILSPGGGILAAGHPHQN